MCNYSSKRFKLRWISFRRQSEEAKNMALISGSVSLKFLLFGKYSPTAMLRPTKPLLEKSIDVLFYLSSYDNAEK